MMRLTRALALMFCLVAPCGRSAASVGCPADHNNDQSVNVNDLIGVINSWGPCTGGPLLCAADIAPLGGNGSINVEDLLAVLNGWGACPCLPTNNCLPGTAIWCEDFQLSNYSRWTGGYEPGSACESMNFATDLFVGPPGSGGKSHRSRVTCSTGDSHRGYGGLRFQGNSMVPSFSTPSTGGISAPNGVVVTFWSRVEAPYTFDPNRWLSLMTITHDCSNNWASVLCLNLDDSSMRLKPVHVSSVTYAPGAPAFPRNQWNRITVYVNYYTGSMHVWQNGTKVVSATFSRPGSTMCQWHWGLYASGPNNNVTLHEDNISIVRLDAPLTNFTAEPTFPGSLCVAGP